MDQTLIQSLAKLLNQVINNEEPQFHITNSNHVSMYLNIFSQALEHNGGLPVSYERFSEELFNQLFKDNAKHDRVINQFQEIWTGWVNIYNYLLERGNIRE